jgi:hypothetical protein
MNKHFFMVKSGQSRAFSCLARKQTDEYRNLHPHWMERKDFDPSNFNQFMDSWLKTLMRQGSVPSVIS